MLDNGKQQATLSASLFPLLLLLISLSLGGSERQCARRRTIHQRANIWMDLGLCSEQEQLFCRQDSRMTLKAALRFKSEQHCRACDWQVRDL
jgi:hypothetical protein